MTKTVRVETLKAGDVLALGPVRMPVVGIDHDGDKVLVHKVSASTYPLVYRAGELVQVVKA